ncbi:uncharacterized protein K02A2.6-like [Rhagoletis pomonella]|uniref:uncharacterized protein K02A2.6-like n=1 Tax=Rhagoletis pomonella TaxID=28610 RepID=UPI00177FFCD6|nr:uncharacterized protein K02A2.6-like [Rhagoletis pomonella]
MENFLANLLARQQEWSQQMLAQQQQFFAQMTNRHEGSPLSGVSTAAFSAAVPRFHSFDEEKHNFASYKTQLDEHFKAYGVEDVEKKRSFLLSWIGDDAFRLLQKLVGKHAIQSLSYEEIVAKFEVHFKTKTHIIKTRHDFYKRQKREGETYKQWVTELQSMAQNCNFVCKNDQCGSEYVDELIRDLLILYSPDEPVRGASLHKENPTLEEVMQIAETFESTQATMKSIKDINNKEVDIFAMQKRRQYSEQQRKKDLNNRESQLPACNERKKDLNNRESQLPACNGCFKKHKKSDCKYLKVKCYKCGRIGHIATVCKSVPNFKHKQVNVLEDVENCNLVNSNIITRAGNKMFIDIEINDTPMKFQFDTGSVCSVIGLSTYESLRKPTLYSTSTKLFGYGSVEVPILGAMQAKVKIGDEVQHLELIVANSEMCTNIFGLNWYDQFKAVQVFQIIQNSDLKKLCDDYNEILRKELGRYLSDAYLQIELDEESKDLTVVNTPLGLYQYQRLPIGVASVPAIFQRLIEEIINGIPGCINYLDDIICTGKSEAEHLDNLPMLFKRLKDYGLRCNFEKCTLMQESVEYLGHVICAAGIQQSEKNTEAIKNLPRPTNLAELQSFMGKVNYYCTFIKDYSTLCGPLNFLRKKNQKFVWNSAQENAFQELKKQIVDMTKLVHFDESLPIILATDASSFGIGAVISHRYPDGSERPIAHASKTLNDAQKNYSQIEKEALSIIFGILQN